VTGLDFLLVHSDDPNLAVVQLDGEIDLSNAAELTERLAELASTSMLILDLNRVSFVDSAALHCLFRAARERGQSRLVLVVDPSSPIHDLRDRSAPARSPDRPAGRGRDHTTAQRVAQVFVLDAVGTEAEPGRRPVQAKGATTMGISLSIFLIAIGAILAWAVDAEVSGIDIQVAGIILLVVGVIGFIASLVFWSSWGGFGNRDAAAGGQNTTIVERDRA
jgi:anti-anti-sigma factor